MKKKVAHRAAKKQETVLFRAILYLEQYFKTVLSWNKKASWDLAIEHFVKKIRKVAKYFNDDIYLVCYIQQ